MKILFLSAEVAPYVTVGGLSQVMYFLPRALKERGHDVRLFTPWYGGMDKTVRTRPEWRFTDDTLGLHVPTALLGADIGEDGDLHQVQSNRREQQAVEYGGSAAIATAEAPLHEDGDIVCDVRFLRPEKGDAPAYFLVNEEYFGKRANVFGYSDDHVRFALLSKACLMWIKTQQRLDDADEPAWVPDVVHCHDWHTSYAIEMARRGDRFRVAFRKIPFLLTVHNFRYQGNGDFRYVRDEDRDDGTAMLASLTSPLLQRQNALLRGLLFSDAVTTVSPTHAHEVLTPEFAYGMDDVLQKERGKLSGILNGIDTTEFNPATDAVIAKRFSPWRAPYARAANKRDLQKEFGLPADDAAMLFGFVGRLTSQKGLEMLIPALTTLLENRDDVQFVALGGGEDRFRTALEELQARFPKKVGLYLMSDFRLPRKVFAGSDALLIPSTFEPGGIVALEALRYGAVPIVRRTGGLGDSIDDFDPSTRKGNGFSFVRKDPWALYGSMVEALVTFKQKSLWTKLVSNALACDFSWKHAAEEYDDWYDRAVKLHKRATLTPRTGLHD